MSLLLFVMTAHAAEIRDIHFEQHDDATRMHVIFTGESDFQAKILTSPPQLRILMRDKAFADQKQPPHFISPFQKVSIDQRQDQRQDHLALTVDLDTPAIIQSAFVVEGEPHHHMVIDIIPAPDEDAFLQHVNIPHGPLVLESDSGDVAHRPLSKPDRSNKPIIMIDAGHGGIDPGAISRGGIQEKRITLAIAKKLADRLNKTGLYDARLTRDRDVFIRLHDRVAMAKAAQADLFLSIHADSVRGGHNLTGASVYTLSDTASDAHTAALANRENAVDARVEADETESNDHMIKTLLIDMSMNDTVQKSRELADHIVMGFARAGVKTIRGPHRHAGFVVLTNPNTPSVLIETGFLSNEKQAQDLLTPAAQSKIIEGIMTAIAAYL